MRGCKALRAQEKQNQTLLLQRAKDGDEQALAALIAGQMPLIRAVAARSLAPGLEFEDAVQEGLIALFFAMGSYREAGGASFSTYAAACIRNGIADAARRANRRKHAPLNQSVPLDDAGSLPVPGGPAESAEAKEQYSATMQELETRLSPLEKQVWALFLDGFSYSAIARRLSIGEKAVDNALQRVRTKLKQW